MEELLLWRWSTLVQITSAWMLMVFFWMVRRSTARDDLDAWVGAWLANGLALAVTCAYWLQQPPGWMRYVLTTLYVASKTAFVLLLLLGTVAFARQARPSLRAPLAWVVVGALLLAPWLRGIPAIGVTQCFLIVCLLGVAMGHCLRHRGQGLGWLALGFALRCALAVAEGVCYGMSLLEPAGELPRQVQTFLAVHSSFDTGAEWMIALGCVLAYAHRVQHELSRSNADLRAAQGELMTAAQHDPLTGLHNRRMLPQLFDAASAQGGWLLFFDVDGLKTINDRDGHAAGDALLQRFGEALRATFAGGGAVVRYAGDEFLAILPAGVEPMAAVAALRARFSHRPRSVSVWASRRWSRARISALPCKRRMPACTATSRAGPEPRGWCDASGRGAAVVEDGHNEKPAVRRVSSLEELDPRQEHSGMTCRQRRARDARPRRHVT